MTDDELDRARAERKALAMQLIYTNMPGHAERVARQKDLVEAIETEDARRASLSGLSLVEQKLLNERENVASNRRMAGATEAAARSSADAARWAKWAAIFTAMATLASLVTALLQARDRG